MTVEKLIAALNMARNKKAEIHIALPVEGRGMAFGTITKIYPAEKMQWDVITIEVDNFECDD